MKINIKMNSWCNFLFCFRFNFNIVLFFLFGGYIFGYFSFLVYGYDFYFDM